ncbi:MAG TPA: orotidine-5'-phosphate decarboxylase [Porticoccaceae bacterium]|nr:orotidine-5'-phosphate decarboxylase [Porticoccaceae bacterium]HCO58843.1 orotidine-5'-phosphate decarboxylase [Porticoccaceae bacterium]
MPQSHSPRVIVALDYPAEAPALTFVDQLDPALCRVKVGKELFTRCGPQLVTGLVNRGFDVFLDLKFHDIPNTVAGAISACADLGVWMVNVHCSGGRDMLEAARKALENQGGQTLLVGVTVLTSLNQQNLREIGVERSPEEQVLSLAALAVDAGLDGVVCSGHEAGRIRTRFGDEFLRVTPGIRPSSYRVTDDQQRVLTPARALAEGSSYLVIGRPITGAENPVNVLLAIKKEIGEDI